jgi:hypothetical protein
MTFFNKIYSGSTERIIAPSPSTNTFGIELQHPQPRRRQILDHNHENDPNKDQCYARAYSIPSKQGEFPSSEHNQSSLRNNVVTIPTNLPTITASDPIIVPSLPEIVEEK